MSTAEPPTPTDSDVCYRHPDRPSGVSCQRCDRTICPSCMNQASVGVHCPECAKGSKQKVYNARTLPGADAVVTRTLIGINVVVWVLSLLLYRETSLAAGGDISEYIGLNGIDVDANREWWRIVTSGFGHFGVFHLGMNMYSLWLLGRIFERNLGPGRFALVYGVSLLGGSVGALVESPLSQVMGASGAIFGLLGMMVMLARSRGIGIQESGLMPVLLINLVISLSGFVSLGGHLGGFLTGIALGGVFYGVDPARGPLFGRDQMKPVYTAIVFGLVLFGAAVVAAGGWEAALLNS